MTRAHSFHLARSIVRNPASSRTVRRYTAAQRLYRDALMRAGVDPSSLIPRDEREDAKHPSSIAMALIYARCGPKNHGCEALGALSTGGAIRSAVVSYWRSRGVNGDYVDLGNGAYRGNPGKNPDLWVLIKSLARRQKECGSHDSKKAYQMTHEDIRGMTDSCVEPFVHRALNAGLVEKILEFECAILCAVQFASVSRADEMLRLDIESLKFTGNTIDAPITATLEYTKNNLLSKTHFTFTRGVHISICGLSALLR